jgi:hypothetical protein
LATSKTNTRTIRTITINYDIDLDLRIIGTIAQSKGQTINISELRNILECYALTLYKHIDNLSKWGLILDEKPKRNGYPRRISLEKNYRDCVDELISIKHAIDTINQYFGS